ncbi:MAG: HAD-IA family hydrolase, partial [Candidatus Cloacimonetes bacterium]|nr:HAD-IA family hydrolase [Candidatus Cloacimonadota bacterium]
MIFDLDGTLIDSSEGIVHAVSEALRNLGYPMLDEGVIKSLIGPPIGKEIVKELDYGDKELKEFNAEFRHLYKTKYLMEAEIYPGIEGLLSRLSDQKFMAVATNKRIDYTLILMDGLGLSKYFDIIEGSDLEGRLEKHDLIDKCLESSGHLPSETVVVGDTAHDASAAKSC